MGGSSWSYVITVLMLGTGVGRAEEPAGEIALRDGLVLAAVGRGGRASLPADAVAAQLAEGRWQTPRAGDTVPLPGGGTRTWEKAAAGADGWLIHPALNGGYAHFVVEAKERQVMILETSGHPDAAGHTLVYVNGEPRAGDPYQTGYVRLPVLLKPGKNEFLFQGRSRFPGARGRLRAKLVPPRSGVQLDGGDWTLPDLVVGEPVQTHAAVVVLNASSEPLRGLVLRAALGDNPPTSTPLPAVPPLGVRKVGFRLEGSAPAQPGSLSLEVAVARADNGQAPPLDTLKASVRVRRSEDTHKRTFVSALDGSVQYYAINPARPLPGQKTRPALFLTLHGAAVEAIGQADAYSPKAWGHLVAPTNRRPYGFDWEDWGRLDALEVLELAQRTLDTDPQRTYLTGHSMGGHGVWHLGATFPDRFAAIGPSAGWISFFSYAGGRRIDNPTPLPEILQRATAPSNTLSLSRNYAQHGVYILHGATDDNVPAAQAREMNRHLAEFHRDFIYHEQPGAGHWWDASDEPGADCVDWAPLFDFFARHIIPTPESIRQVDFTTASPGVSAWSHWLGIEAQQKQLQPSRVNVRFDPGKRRFVGTTDNVARLAFRLDHVLPGESLTVELDGQKLTHIPWPTQDRRLWLTHADGKWALAPRPPAGHKGPQRHGPFKEAFRNRMLFVYGTQGSPEENAWALARARYDAETMWYRGNGSIDVLPDREFDAAADPDRNVILYGNAETNGAWKALLAASPVQVRRGRVQVGDREEAGADLACLFLRPRPGSDRAAVGIVAGSGLVGMRLTDRVPVFVSGTAYPDCLVFGPRGADGDGTRVAGFFGLDWGVAGGEFVWRK
jgi:dienelactone hydrolase